MSETSEVLRRASGLMRERAGRSISASAKRETGLRMTFNDSTALKADEATLAFSFSPAVALAVADWLDLVARAVDAAGGMKAATLATQANAYAALDVARKYLGADQ